MRSLTYDNLTHVACDVECKRPVISRKGLIRRSSHEFMEDYDTSNTKSLGEGGFGNVFQVKHRLTGQQRAAKRISGVAHNSALQSRSDLETEILSLMELDHPQICKLYEYFIKATPGKKGKYDVTLILELFEGVNFLDRMVDVARSARRRFDELEAGILMKQMLRGVLGCHALGIVHRDVKPENFMYADKGQDPSSLKLLDLGLSRRQWAKEGSTSDLKMSSSSQDLKGTFAYMSPEVAQALPFGPSADVWSLGVILYGMLTGKPLFAHDTNGAAALVKQIVTRSHLVLKLQKPEFCVLSDDARDLVRRMLERDPSKRITGEEALRHPFIVKCDSEELQLEKVDPLPMSTVVDRMYKFSSLPLLEQTALATAAHVTSTNDEDARRISATFRMLDKRCNGHVNASEFREGVLRAFSGRPRVSKGDETNRAKLDDEDAALEEWLGMDFFRFEREVFRLVDLDQSGELTITELEAACLDRHRISTEQWRAVFEILDASHNWSLDEEDDWVSWMHGRLNTASWKPGDLSRILWGRVMHGEHDRFVITEDAFVARMQNMYHGAVTERMSCM